MAPRSSYLRQRDAHDRAAALGTCLHDQVGRAGLVPHVDVGLRDPVGQRVEHHLGSAGVTGLGHLVPARRGLGDVAERVHLLVAGEHQALGAGLDHRLLLVERALELHPERLDPVEVLDAVVAEGPDLVLVGVEADRHQVLEHLLGRVLDAGGLLHRGPAAEVEVAAGHRAGAAVLRGPLEQDDARTGPGRLECGARAGDPEPDHDDVDLVAPRLHIGGVDGWRQVQGHGASLRTN